MADEITTGSADSPFVFRITGLDGLRRYIDRHPQVINSALEQVLRTLHVRIQRDTPVGIKRKGKPKGAKRVKGVSQVRYVASGAMKKSWQSEKGDGYVSVWTDTPYAGVLEEGKFRGVGKPRYGLGSGGAMQISPRTVAAQGGIYSSRAVGGIIGPLLTDQELVGKFTSQVIREIQKSFPR